MVKLTLRAKTIGTGLVVAAALSILAALSTYVVAREYMLRQRTDVAVAQVVAATRLVSASIASGTASKDALRIGATVLPGARAALNDGGTWYVSGVGLSEDDVPPQFAQLLADGKGARQRIVLRAEPIAIVGYPLSTESEMWFIGVASLKELSRTLSTLQTALSIGVALGSVGGGVVGWRLSRRVMEPLHNISDTAVAISDGHLDRRVDEPKEPDLARIARSFNEMTDSLRSRIERESRFGATVSHELRTPLTVIKSAADLIATNRSELPARVQQTVDTLTLQIDEFAKTLNDLIEIARYQSGSVSPQLETVSSTRILTALATRHDLDPRCIDVEEMDIVVDVRRLAQIFANLKKNADLYAGGLDVVSGTRVGDFLVLHFDDSGSGIPPAEVNRIFEPFSRGARHSGFPGSGLGLTITREHARAMGGDLTLESRANGGCRFIVTLPIDPQHESPGQST
ncbi:MAG: ATP-binding protein [Ilumatobacteraceae bacterium]|jgi:signal transduction histidine kinase